LQVISWESGSAFIDEATRLGLKNTAWVMLRQIFLKGDGVPWTFGRLVVPEQTYLQHAEKFDNLGERLLGETLLHNNPAVERSPFEYALLGQGVWARRSVFTLEGAPLLLTEAFLPAIPLYAKTTG